MKLSAAWFGGDIFVVDGYTGVHSGYSDPQDGDSVQRHEGVAVVMDRYGNLMEGLGGFMVCY